MIRISKLAALIIALLLVPALVPPAGSAGATVPPKEKADAAPNPGAQKTKIDAPWIGIYFESLPVLAGKKLSYPHDTGIFISKVIEGGPAARAGMREGDVMYRFGGTVVKDQEHFLELIRARRPGDRVAVELFRLGDERVLEVVLGSQGDRKEIPPVIGRYEEALKAQERAMRELSDFYSRSYLTRGRIGLRLRDLNDDLASYFGVDRDTGVLVLDVDAESSAARAGIKAGDVIVAVNGSSVSSSEGVARALGGVEPGDLVSIGVIRKGARRTFDVEVESSLSESPGVFAVPRVEDGIRNREGLEREPDARRIDEELKRLRKDESSRKIETELDSLRARIAELEKLQKELEKKNR